MTGSPSRILVVTVVHDPRDARIAHRQIPALVEAGLDVTYAAPFTAFGATPIEGTRGIDLPRSHGRHRIAAGRAARRLLREEGPLHDIVLLHDPELLAAVPRRLRTAVVWDVHEDTAAALSLKAWLPPILRTPAAAGVRWLERRAERRHGILLAEDAYARRFERPHPVVRNTTTVPDRVPSAGDDRVVYLGAVTRARGALEMAELGRELSDRVRLELIGPVAADVADELERAEAAGHLVLHGFVPNDEAVRRLEGALAGLSLLHDEPNYRHSSPTKVVEYMAHGVPVVTTPLPLARSLVEPAGAGIVVPFDDAAAAVAAVERLRQDPGLRSRMAEAGHRAALDGHDWRSQGPAFVDSLVAEAGAHRR